MVEHTRGAVKRGPFAGESLTGVKCVSEEVRVAPKGKQAIVATTLPEVLVVTAVLPRLLTTGML